MPEHAPAAPRRRLHTRRIAFEGFQRDDGLFDLEARLTDVKDQALTLLSGVRRAGDLIHDMHVRVTIDRAFTIVDLVARTDASPYPDGCETIGPHYRQLIGANLLSGFRRKLHETMGHVKGCTHITEMLAALPTAAVQTFAGLKAREDEGTGKPFQLDRCHALETSSETVRVYYPRWYRGAA